MYSADLYKVKHHSGRILGPLDAERVRLLILKNQIPGVELAKVHPDGAWEDINRIPEIAEMLFANASGKLGSSTTLKSEQSSYRPILSPTHAQFAPTVVLAQSVAPEPPKSEAELAGTISMQSRKPQGEERTEGEDRTVLAKSEEVLHEDIEPTLLDSSPLMIVGNL